MKQILTKSHRVEVARFSLVFDSLKHRGSGYAFDCDADGKLAPLTDIQKESFRIASDKTQYECVGVQDYSYSYMEPAVMQCYCGQHVTLQHPLDNDCECGKAFNLFGQEVIPGYGRRECIEDGWAYDENDY